MSSREPAGYRVGADVGGTFTDVVAIAPDGGFLTRKVPSTADDYGRGIVGGLADLLDERGIARSTVDEVIHGTTVATNAILEGTGAPTALVTTRGFRDVLELRRLRTPALYDLFYRPPRPIVERRLRLEVDERIGAGGVVVAPLDEESARAAAHRIRESGVAAVAVCLLHSYANPSHERRVGAILREHLPDAYLSLSVDVLPEIREYERTSTTVVNAYVGPLVDSYLRSLDARLRAGDFRARLSIMQSSGGLISAGAAVAKPAQIVESGPAAGVVAAQQLGRRIGEENLITFDMGGTTAKASLIERGRVNRTTEYEVGAGISLSSRLIKGGGHALKLPVLDIAEVGAGGGSIVWVDRGGLHVGPRSAGANPGPACYGAGGADPTVTDANVMLGYLNPRQLAGGQVRLEAALAERALAERVAGPLGMDLASAAHGAYVLANTNMIRAIKAVTTYRGRDPRDFVLLAFGGNGPVHAAAIARSLGIRRVVVPPAPGLFSALGLLEARHEVHRVRTFFGRLAAIDAADLAEAHRRLAADALATLADQRTAEAAVALERSVDLRYAGQAYELTVTCPDGAPDLIALAEAFEREHEATYGHRARGEPIEIVNARVAARLERAETPPFRPRERAAGATGERRAYFGRSHGWLATPVVGRFDLDPTPTPGPLIVEEYDATTLVPPGCAARRDAFDNIAIDVIASDDASN